MGVNKYNSEGYYDPTTYEAMTNIEREVKKKPYRPLVFICSPFAGDVPRNTQRTRDFCKFAVDMGAIPLAPHLLYPQFMDDTNKEQRSLGLFFGFVLMGKCDELWVCGGQISKGMKMEIMKARLRGLPIKFINMEEIENGK